MLVKFATPESTPAGTLRSGSPGVVTSGVQRQQQIARAVVRKDLLLVRGAAPSTPRKRPSEMPLPQDGIKRCTTRGGGQSIASCVVESHSPSSVTAINIAAQMVQELRKTSLTTTSMIVEPASQVKRPSASTVLPSNVEEPWEEDRLCAAASTCGQ